MYQSPFACVISPEQFRRSQLEAALPGLTKAEVYNAHKFKKWTKTARNTPKKTTKKEKLMKLQTVQAQMRRQEYETAVTRDKMSFEAGKRLADGYNAGFDLENADSGLGVSHLLDKSKLTDIGIKRETENKYVMTADEVIGLGEFSYSVQLGKLKNIPIPNDTGYLPPLMGSEYHFTDTRKSDSITINASDPRMITSIQFPLDFRFRSVIFPLTVQNADAIVQMVKGELQNDMDISAIGRINTTQDQFCYPSESMFRRSRTADYEIVYEQVESSYKPADTRFQLHICRKMVTAVINATRKSSDGMMTMIPIHEEVIIQPQQKSNDVFIHTGHAIVITALANEHTALHFFGNNALTFFTFDNEKMNTENRLRSSMNTAGKVIRCVTNAKERTNTSPSGGNGDDIFQGVITDISDTIDKTIEQARRNHENNVRINTRAPNFGKEGREIPIDKNNYSFYNFDTASLISENMYKERLSRSFIGKQMEKSIIGSNKFIREWEASATFSLISIEQTIIKDAKKKIHTYVFVQTYAMTPAAELDNRRISDFRAKSKAVQDIKTNRINKNPIPVEDYASATTISRKIDRIGMKANSIKAERGIENMNGSLELREERRKSKSITSVSSFLPPELELELELMD